ncbi:MAG: hypothetical protein RLZZ374_1641, partial [Cyanobacteriota bacterium]
QQQEPGGAGRTGDGNQDDHPPCDPARVVVVVLIMVVSGL